MLAGTVLITFKSPRSIPPYRIENHCDDVYVYFAQSQVAWDRTKWNWLEPRLGGACMAYAWDEPIYPHQLTIQVGLIVPFLDLHDVKAWMQLSPLICAHCCWSGLRHDGFTQVLHAFAYEFGYTQAGNASPLPQSMCTSC